MRIELRRLLTKSVSWLSLSRRRLVTMPRITAFHKTPVVDNILHPAYDVEIPNVPWPEFIWKGLSGHEDMAALVCGLTGRTLSHGEVREQALRFSASLQDAGIGRGSVLGVLLPNCLEYAGVVLGSLHAGATVTTMNPEYTPHELARQLKASRAKILVAANNTAEKVRETNKIYNELDNVIFVDAENQGNTSAVHMEGKSVPFEQFLSRNTAVAPGEVDCLRDPAILPFSSGTTGAPKGVMLSHHNMVGQALVTTADGEFFYRAFGQFQDVTISILPMFHIFGLGVTMNACLWAGAKQVILPRFDPGLFISALTKHRPTFLHLVPPLVGFLANHPDVTTEHLSSMRQVNVGGAPSGTSLISQFQEKAGPHVIYREGWGMTEVCGGATGMNRTYQGPDCSGDGSVNVLLPNYRLRVVHPETNKVLGPGESGEIQLQGECVMLGYLDNPEATAETVDSSGWLHSGDIGHFTEEGVIFISDRMKELIKVKGLQVAPAELEDVLRGLEGVKDVAVVGVEDQRAGQLPRAFIVRDEGLTEEDVNDFMQIQVSSHKQLKGGIVFVQQIPKSASGKILRRELASK